MRETIALGFSLIAGLYLASQPPGWMVIPLVLITWVLLATAPAQNPPDSTLTPFKVMPRRWILAAALLTFITLTAIHAWNVSHHIQMACLILSLSLLILGISDNAPLHRYRLNLSLIAILILAFMVRMIALNDTLRTLVDEMHFVSGVLRFWHEPDIPILRPMTLVSPFTWIYPYIQTWTITFFGRDFEGIRAASALIGVANVAALWWAARWMVSERAALLAAAMLAVFPPHVHFSRLAIIQIADPLFGTLAIGALARAWRTGSPRGFMLAGVMLGMTAYFYEAGRLLFPVLIALWAIWYRRNWRGIGLMIFAAVVTAVPVYLTIFGVDGALTGRLDASGSIEWRAALGGDADALHIWLEKGIESATLLVNRAEPYGLVMYGGSQPLILAPLVPLFLLGVGVALNRRDTAVFPLWIGLTILGSSVLSLNMVTSRYVVGFPAMAFVLALGLDWMLTHITTRKALIYLTIALIMSFQVDYYFRLHLPQINEQYRTTRRYKDVEEAIWRVTRTFPPDTHIHLMLGVGFDSTYSQDWLFYLRDDMAIMTYEQLPPAGYLARLREETTDRPLAIIINPGDIPMRERLREYFPIGEPLESDSPFIPDDQIMEVYAVLPPELLPPADYDNPSARYAREVWIIIAGLVLWGNHRPLSNLWRKG